MQLEELSACEMVMAHFMDPGKLRQVLTRVKCPKGYWIAHPNEVIPAGTYMVEDSDPATWSQNSESPCGFTKVEGYATKSSVSGNTGALATGIKEPESRAEDEASYEVDASDGEAVPHSIVETISSAIKKSTAVAKREPVSIEESTYSSYPINH